LPAAEVDCKVAVERFYNYTVFAHVLRIVGTVETFLEQFGYWGIFLISYLSATLLPLVSEAAVVAVYALGLNVWLIILFSTTGSVLGSVTNYYIGKKGTDFVLARYFKMEPETLVRAERFFARWGSVTLFFSWVPFIGDPLTLVAGIAHVEFRVFIFWVTTGKLLRQLVILGIASRLLPILT
jgi:membrane protein YqaA with SNARE-associated domain